MNELIPQIEKIVAPVIEARGYEIVEIQVAGFGSSSVLRIFVYRSGGVMVGELERLSREISDALDKANIIDHKYYLEVSSPGLDRQLRTVRDFIRAISEKVRIIKQSGETVEGILVDANADRIVLVVDGENELEMPFEQVSVGKIIY